MSKRLRFLLVLMVVAIGGVFLYPTYRWYFLASASERKLANGTREQIRTYAKEKAGEGLSKLRDLAQASPDAALPEEFFFLRGQVEQNYEAEGRSLPETWSITKVLEGFRGQNDLFDHLEEVYRENVLTDKGLKERILQLGLDLSGGMSVSLQADLESLTERLGHEPTEEDKRDSVERAMEVITSRIDKFGVTEPQVRRQSSGQILIEIPGEVDTERVDALLLGKGKLQMHIVDDEATRALVTYVKEHPDFSPETVQTEELPFFEAGQKIMSFYKKDAYGMDVFQRYIVVKEEVGFDGEHIESARLQRHYITNLPIIATEFDKEGSESFYKFTSDNKGRSAAIVFNEKVRAALRITEAIRDSAWIEGFNEKEARELALVLRTASLPIDLKITSAQAVGASLGSDSIRLGLRAILYGLVAVLIFMLLYYKGAGLVANLALLLNLFLITAVLSSFNMTLTMTSLAGLILTVGMAVDANVIIFERIREELRLGKTRRGAIEAGFKKAFWTIMDANITTFIAAIFLSQLGKGPIQGFAVMLAVGIVCSLFTAIFVSRLLFDVTTDFSKREKLSIGWR